MNPSYLFLDKPAGLEPGSWAAIQVQLDRLRLAVGAQDRSLVVGTSKERVETVARVVLDARGQPAASGAEFDKVLGAAHGLLEYQTGPGLTQDPAVRAIAAGAKKIAGRLRELRNTSGTGHGHASVPVVEDEAVAMCVDAALMWTRWALRRLEHMIAGSPTQLVSDLRNSTFVSGSLADRLQAANLPELEVEDQRLLGLAVGQRASRNTFNVRIEGVEACANDQNDAAWPPAYRDGVVAGLFINHEGQVEVDDYALAPRLAAGVLASHPDAALVLSELARKLENAAWSSSFSLKWRDVVAQMRLLAGSLPTEARATWSKIADEFTRVGDEYEEVSRSPT